MSTAMIRLGSVYIIYDCLLLAITTVIYFSYRFTVAFTVAFLHPVLHKVSTRRALSSLALLWRVSSYIAAFPLDVTTRSLDYIRDYRPWDVHNNFCTPRIHPLELRPERSQPHHP